VVRQVKTWSGRGAKPRWLVAAIKGGKKLDDFLIDKSARKGRKATLKNLGSHLVQHHEKPDQKAINRRLVSRLKVPAKSRLSRGFWAFLGVGSNF